jgi:hypothetical protein
VRYLCKDKDGEKIGDKQENEGQASEGNMIQEAGKFSNRTAEIKPLRPILKKSNTIVVDTDENGDSINP